MLGARHELHVGTHHAEGLVDIVTASVFDDDLPLFYLRLFVEELAYPCPAVLLIPLTFLTDILRYLTDERHGETLDILTSAHLRVHLLEQVDDDGGQCQTEQQGCQEDHLSFGRDGLQRTGRSGHHAGVVGGEGL